MPTESTLVILLKDTRTLPNESLNAKTVTFPKQATQSIIDVTISTHYKLLIVKFKRAPL